MMNRPSGRMARKEAIRMEELMDMYIRSMKLASGLNRQRVFSAWNDVSGAAKNTVSMFFRNGVLYVGLNSSVVRNRLYFMRKDLVRLVNNRLASDELFTPEGKGGDYVKDIVLK